MTFEVYGIREVGSKELRYIGQTGRGRRSRLNFLVALARQGVGERDMREWLRSCSYQVEAIVLSRAGTREEAKRLERVAIECFWAAGHGLLNRQGVPRNTPDEAIAALVREAA